MDFASKVRNILKAKGFTQVELAECLGTSQQVVSRWLESNTPPKAAYLLKLARALGVTADYLIDDAQETPGSAEPEVSVDERYVVRTIRALNLTFEEAVRRLAMAAGAAEFGGNAQPVKAWEAVGPLQDQSDLAQRQKKEQEERRLGFELEADLEADGSGELNPFPRRRR